MLFLFEMNVIVLELKSEALKERHWKTLMSELRVNWNLNDLTLGNVWDVDLMKHESAIKQVLGRRLTTVFPRQGHYAHDPAVLAKYPPADITNPAIVATRSGIFEWFVIPSIAMS